VFLLDESLGILVFPRCGSPRKDEPNSRQAGRVSHERKHPGKVQRPKSEARWGESKGGTGEGEKGSGFYQTNPFRTFVFFVSSWFTPQNYETNPFETRTAFYQTNPIEKIRRRRRTEVTKIPATYDDCTKRSQSQKRKCRGLFTKQMQITKRTQSPGRSYSALGPPV
jgi:hypothetical protein